MSCVALLSCRGNGMKETLSHVVEFGASTMLPFSRLLCTFLAASLVPAQFSSSVHPPAVSFANNIGNLLFANNLKGFLPSHSTNHRSYLIGRSHSLLNFRCMTAKWTLLPWSCASHLPLFAS